MSVLEQIIAEQETQTWPDALPDHLSASSMKLYMRCREAYRRRYLDKAEERSSHYFVWGAAHNFALVETNFFQKITTGVDLPIAEVQEAFAAEVDRKVERDGGDDEIEWGKDLSRASLKDRGVELVAAYHREVSPKVQPVAVEQHFEVAVPGCPVTITGYVDVVEAHKIDDLKTAAKRELSPADVFQGHVYQLAFQREVDFHIATKTKVPAVYTAADYPEFGLPWSGARGALTGRMVANVAGDIAATFARYGPDQPWPGAYTTRSTCSMCGHRPTCPWWTT